MTHEVDEGHKAADADGGDHAAMLMDNDEDATLMHADASSDDAAMQVDDDEIINECGPCFTEDRAADNNSMQFDGDVDGDEIIDDWLMMLMAGALTRDDDAREPSQKSCPSGDHGTFDYADNEPHPSLIWWLLLMQALVFSSRHSASCAEDVIMRERKHHIQNRTLLLL